MLRQSNMGHITDQYGPYYQPIWAILQAHPLPLPKGLSGEELGILPQNPGY